MVLDIGPATLADLRPNVGRPRSFLGLAIQSLLLAYQVEGKTPEALDRLRRTLEDFNKFAQRNGLPQELSKFTPYHIRLYLVHLQQRGLAPSTVNWHYRCLHLFWEWSKREGIVEENPLKPIRPPKVPRKVVQVLGEEHIGRLLSLCPPVSLLLARNRAIILTLLGTGLRRAELARLQLADVDLGHECVKVMGKGQKERQVYLGKTIIKAMLTYVSLPHDTQPCLWVSEEGRPLSDNAIQQVIYDMKNRAGICRVRVSAHTFRHTFAVNALRAGVSRRHLQSIGGWANMRPLETYLATIDAEDGMEAHRKAEVLARMGVK